MAGSSSFCSSTRWRPLTTLYICFPSEAAATLPSPLLSSLGLVCKFLPAWWVSERFSEWGWTGAQLSWAVRWMKLCTTACHGSQSIIYIRMLCHRYMKQCTVRSDSAALTEDFKNCVWPVSISLIQIASVSEQWVTIYSGLRTYGQCLTKTNCRSFSPRMQPAGDAGEIWKIDMCENSKKSLFTSLHSASDVSRWKSVCRSVYIPCLYTWHKLWSKHEQVSALQKVA